MKITKKKKKKKIHTNILSRRNPIFLKPKVGIIYDQYVLWGNNN
jgi:hypothetical protein